MMSTAGSDGRSSGTGQREPRRGPGTDLRNGSRGTATRGRLDVRHEYRSGSWPAWYLQRFWFTKFRAFSAKLNLPESPNFMFDTETTALLRAVLEEVCECVSHREIGARTHVASKIPEAATRGEVSVDGLRQVGRDALSHAPTMWR